VAFEVMPGHVHLFVETSPADSLAHVDTQYERPWRKEKTS
jgi:REP element-mobilizing transposase RayT